MATLRLCVVTVCVGVLSALLSPAFAQVAGGRGAPQVLIDKLSITEVRTPDFNTKSHPSVKNTETWLQLLVDFKVEAAEEKVERKAEPKEKAGNRKKARAAKRAEAEAATKE